MLLSLLSRQDSNPQTYNETNMIIIDLDKVLENDKRTDEQVQQDIRRKQFKKLIRGGYVRRS